MGPQIGDDHQWTMEFGDELGNEAVQAPHPINVKKQK